MDDSSLYSILDDAFDLLPEAWDDSSPDDTAPASPPVLRPKPRSFSPVSTPSTTNQWDPRLIIDLAVGVDSIEEILPRYNMTEKDFLVLSENLAFRQELALTIRDVKENGLTFKHRARVQAEAYLEVLDELIYTEATPASTRLEAIKSTVRWAGLDEQAKNEDNANTTQVLVNISF